MKFQPSARFLLRIAFATALSIPGCLALGQTATDGSAELPTDPMKRLEWLKSRTPPTPAPRRANFRTSVSRAPGLRTPEVRPPAIKPVDAPAPASRPVDAATPAPRAPASRPPASRPADEEAPVKRPSETKTAATRKSESRPPVVPPVEEPTPTKRSSEKKAPAPSTPEPRINTASTRDTKTPAVRVTPPQPPKLRTVVEPTPAPRVSVASISKTLPKITVPLATPTPPPTVARARTVEFKTTTNRTSSDARYPWKTNIVTTVFWVGEPVGGNNFTHNRSSSWDANWAQNFGGYDNPNPEARRRFLPVKFTPRQNPFYIALPYNDVTRGTTKPEARAVIPWFKQDFQREGLSVCRDRWVAVRNRAGQVAYAQWSDCGPFRTDHWQYVFGKERPKPNLNKGAGLDVSPAVRDFLGLDGTDLTDWKFVDFKDVPHGPWSLHGENNHFTQKRKQSPTTVVKAGSTRTPAALARNP